jgi:hypothetical protein
MTDVFDLDQRDWTFNATPSSFLYCTQLPFPGRSLAQTEILKPTHDSTYWAKKTAEFDFTKEDNLGDPERFNRIIWEGLKRNLPYPTETSSANLRKHRCQIPRAGGIVEDSKIEGNEEVTSLPRSRADFNFPPPSLDPRSPPPCPACQSPTSATAARH